jgi:MFS family permease
MMSDHGLRHNRDFQIMCAAQGLSRLGTAVSTIAFPLLVLRSTRSPADTGLVAFAEGAAMAVTLLPAGALADRLHRRGIMIICDVGAFAGMALLAAAVFLGHAPLAVIAVAAVVVSAFGAGFSPAISASLPRIVSASDLPAAVSVNQVRNAAVILAGPALGGLLFEIAPSLPFAVDALSYGISLAGVLALRTRLVAPAGGGQGSTLVTNIKDGLSFIYRQPVIRFTLGSAAVLNSVFNGVLLCVLMTIVRDGSGGLTAGAVIAFAGLGTIIGSMLAPVAKRHLSLRQVLIMLTWICALAVATMAFTQKVPVLAVLMALCTLLVPALNVVSSSIQISLTPDHLQGRTQSATSFTALVLSPFGAMLAGYLLAEWRSGVSFAVLAVMLLALAALTTWTRSLRQAPIPVQPDAPVSAAAAEAR